MKWESARIGDVAKVVSGATPKTNSPSFWGGDIPWITPKDLSSFRGKNISQTFRKITNSGLSSCSTTMLPARSVLFTSRAPIGLVAINAVEMCTNQGFKSIIPNRNLISSDYLYWWLKLNRSNIELLGRGATFKEVSKTIVEDIFVPLPPLPEQKRIAAILDAADALRAKRREAIAQLDVFLQSTFLEMFGDPVTNPKGWKVVPLNEIGKFKSGATPSKSRPDFWNGSIPWVSPKDMKAMFIQDSQDHISNNALSETKLKLLSPGHLLIVVRGMILAHSFPVAINHIPVAINQDMKGIEIHSFFETLFLLHAIRLLKREIVSEVSTAGHGTKRFDAEAMKKITVPVPPLDLQRRFANITEKVEKQKTMMQKHLAELDALFASLQARAFNGEL